jgi:fluoride exporter
MRIVLGIAIAGFLGAVTRYEFGLLFPQSTNAAFPWATLFINLSGSLLLGYLFGFISRYKWPTSFGEVVGTGFLGSFTTFSAFNGQLWLLFQHQAYLSAAAYMLLSAFGGWLLAAVGLAGGRGKTL